MNITELDDAWRVTFFPDAIDYQLEEMKDKGWKVMLGYYKDQYVPKYVDYSKSRFSTDDVIKHAKNTASCPICAKINKDLAKIQSINIKNPDNHIITKMESKKEETQKKTQKGQEIFKDMLMNIFLNTMFTRPGLFFIGSMLDDDSLISRALPTDINDGSIADFTYELAAFFTGDIPLIRSPEELRAYLQALHEVKQPQKKEKKKSTITNNSSDLLNLLIG